MEDLAIRITATNRGPDPAPLHLIPHLWFRNTWSWGQKPGPSPKIYLGPSGENYQAFITDDSMVETLATVPVAYRIGSRTFYAPTGGTPLFTNNETNFPKVFGPGSLSATPYVKDAFHRHIIDGEDCTNPDSIGTKAALHYQFDAVQPGETVTLRFRLTDTCYLEDPLAGIDQVGRPPPGRG